MHIWIARLRGWGESIRILTIVSGLLICSAGILVGYVVHILSQKPPIFLTEWSNREENLLVGGYVASKKGTTYYLPWCGNAFRIQRSNRRIFLSEKEAITAGFRPAKGCRGLVGG